MARATLKARATLDSRDFNTKLAKMGQNVQAFSTGQLSRIGGVVAGAFAIGAVTRFAQAQLEVADRIADVASVSGTGAEAIQALRVAALEFGGSAQKVDVALIALNRRIGAIKNGNETYAKSLRRVAGSQEEYERALRGGDEALDVVTRGLARAKDRGLALEDAQQLMSEAGRELLGTFIAMGNEGIPVAIDRMKELGLVIEEDLIRRMAQLNNELELAQRQAGVAGARGIGGVLRVTEEKGKLGGALTGGLLGGGKGAIVGFGIGGPIGLAIGASLGAIAGGLGGGFLGGKMGAEFEGIQATAMQQRLDELRRLRRKIESERDGGGGVSDAALRSARGIVSGAAQSISGIAVSAPRSADSLASIGGFIGAQTSPVQGAMERAAKAAEISAKADEKLTQLAEKNGLTLEEIRTALEE